MKHLLLVLFCIVCGTASAQRRISGTVSDQFDVIPGANVVEVDKNNRIVSGTTTDFNGNFTLQIKSNSNKLKVSFIGLQTYEEVIGTRSVFKIKLSDNVKQMKEVVKTAKRKHDSGGLSIPQREMTGASQSFNMDEMEGLAFESVDQALQGQIAGLDIVANSGNLGAGTTMRIRGVSTINGSSQPLIVVDDQIFELPEDAQTVNFEDMDNEEMFSTLLNVNTEDIQSIEVLKDAASAAKWGAKGSNGVIEIKLKPGHRGPTRVNFSYKFTGTFQPEGYKMLSGDDYTMMLKQAYSNGGNSQIAIPELDYNQDIGDIYYNYNKNTDWLDAVKQMGAEHRYYVNLTGGGEKATFRVSAGYNTSKGSIIGQKLDQFTATSALDYTVSDRILFKSNVNLSFTTNHKNYTNDILSRAYQAMPNMSIYEYDRNGNETGNYFNMLPISPTVASATNLATSYYFKDMFKNGNPVARAYGAWNDKYQYSLTPNFSVHYKFLSKDDDATQLNYRGTVQLNINTTSDDTYEPAELRTMGWQYNDGTTLKIDGEGISNTRNQLGNSEYKSMEFTTRHELEFYPKFKNEDNFLAALARFDMRTGSSTTQSIGLWNAPTGITDPTVNALMTSTSVGNNEWRSLSWYFNCHYSYKSKYILSGGLNISGSTDFGAGNKYAFYPSVSVRWNISDEKFMNWAKSWLSMLSFSPDWGMTGNTIGGGYYQYNKYSQGSNYVGHNTIRPENLSLTQIKWETTSQWNLRAQLGLFSDLLNFDLDVYNKKTTDLIMNDKRIAASNGFSSLSKVNAGTMRNKGWELYVNTGKICKVGKFSIKLKANIAQNFNEIEEMDPILLSALNGSEKFQPGNLAFNNRVQVGNALGSIYGLKYKGVYAYDYDHNGYTAASIAAYGQSAGDPAHPGQMQLSDGKWVDVNTAAAAAERGTNATCPIAYDADGNMLTDKSGNPLQMYYAYQEGAKYKFEGGDAIYEDINHDGQIDRYDMVYLGNSNPTCNGGFGISLYYDRLTLNASFVFRMGNQVVNMARMTLESMRNNSNQSYATTHRWRKNGDDTTMPRALNAKAGSSYNSLPSDRYVEDGDYLRFNYLQLTYDFDPKLLKKWHINSLKLSASANNLAVWSKYTGVDPEVSPKGFSVAVDNNRTPRTRSFTCNINIGF